MYSVMVDTSRLVSPAYTGMWSMDETFDGKGVGSYSSFEWERFGHDPKDSRWIGAFLANGPLHLPTPLEPRGSFVVCRATGALVDTNPGAETGPLDSENT